MSEAAKRTLRTVLQTAVGLALALPAIVDAAGLPASLPWVAGALAVAGGLARVMALPAVQDLLPGWLRTSPERAPAASAVPPLRAETVEPVAFTETVAPVESAEAAGPVGFAGLAGPAGPAVLGTAAGNDDRGRA